MSSGLLHVRHAWAARSLWTIQGLRAGGGLGKSITSTVLFLSAEADHRSRKVGCRSLVQLPPTSMNISCAAPLGSSGPAMGSLPSSMGARY